MFLNAYADEGGLGGGVCFGLSDGGCWVHGACCGEDGDRRGGEGGCTALSAGGHVLSRRVGRGRGSWKFQDTGCGVGRVHLMACFRTGLVFGGVECIERCRLVWSNW